MEKRQRVFVPSWVLQILLGIGAGLLVLIAAFMGIVMTVGLEMRGLSNLASKMLQDIAPGYRVQMESAKLYWPALNKPIGFQAINVQVFAKADAEGAGAQQEALVLYVPNVEAGVDFWRSLDGTLSLTQLKLIRPIIDARQFQNEASPPQANKGQPLKDAGKGAVLQALSIMPLRPDFETGNILPANWQARLDDLLSAYNLNKLDKVTLADGQFLWHYQIPFSLDITNENENLNLAFAIKDLAGLRLRLPTGGGVGQLAIGLSNLKGEDFDTLIRPWLPQDIHPYLPKDGAISLSTDLTIDQQGLPLSAKVQMALVSQQAAPLFTNLNLEGSFVGGLKQAGWNYQIQGVDARKLLALLQKNHMGLAAIGLNEQSYNGKIDSQGQVNFSGTNFQNMIIKAASKSGQLQISQFYDKPFLIEDFYLDGVVETNPALQVNIAQLRLSLPQNNGNSPAQITLTGAANALEAGQDLPLDLSLKLGLANYPIAELASHWPKGLGQDARDWVTSNIKTGLVSTANLDFAARLTPQQAGSKNGSSQDDKLNANIAVNKLAGKISLKNGSVRFLDDMPVATGVNAVADYSDKHFDISLSSGTLDNQIFLKDGLIKIKAPANPGKDPDATIEIDLALAGDLPRATALVTGPPYDLMGNFAYGFALKSGQILDAKLSFGFPLNQARIEKTMRYQLVGQFKDISLAYDGYGAPVPISQASLVLNNDELLLDGKTAFAEVAAGNFSYNEYYRPKQGRPQSRFSYEGGVPLAGLSKMLPQAGHKLSGGAMINRFGYAKGQDGKASLRFEADLTNAAYKLAGTPFSKQAGRAARLSFAMESEAGNRPRTRLDDFTYTTADNEKIIARALFAPPAANSKKTGLALGKLTNLTAAPFMVGRNNLQKLEMRQVNGDKYNLNLVGDSFDLAPYQAVNRQAVHIENAVSPDQIGNPEASDDADGFLDNSEGSLVVGRLWLDDNFSLPNVTASFLRKDKQLILLSLAAAENSTRILELDISPIANPAQPKQRQSKLVAKGRQAGLLLKAAKIDSEVTGGAFVLQATKSDSDAPYRGTINVDEFSLTNAPQMVRLLQILSITGAASLGEKGLNFQKLVGEFVLNGSEIDLQKLRATGASIGMTAEGKINLATKQVDVKGLVIPADAVSRIIGSIPIIGTVLTGADNEGIIASGYSVKGSFDNLDISANPGTMLAPGLLRDIFQAIGEGGDNQDDIEDGQPSPPQSQPSTDK